MISNISRLLSLSTAIVVASTAIAAAEPSAELIAAAKKEGTLTTIALPHNWCGYGDVIAGFKAKYGIEVNELNPDAGSGDEIEAIKANKGNTGPQAPDVIDVGLSFGPSAKAEGLIQPYKVSTWDSIPDFAKDADGFWYGDYYGVLSFVVNTDIVEEHPEGLGRPEEVRVCQHRFARWRSARFQPGCSSRLRRWSCCGRKGCHEGWRSRSCLLRRAQQGRQPRSGHRQVRVARSGFDPDRRRLGL